ncbi:MAG: hypothetical protein ABGZ49_00960 [Akkermansiaceae bacterium]
MPTCTHWCGCHDQGRVIANFKGAVITNLSGLTEMLANLREQRTS